MGLDSFDGGLRIHAIILTKDRPETLARCIGTSLPLLSEPDALTILDDSDDQASDVVGRTVSGAAANCVSRITHVRARDLHRLVAQAATQRQLCWQTKAAPRDIAPLRNLELLLSVACHSETTVLIDDDIHSFDLKATHDALEQLASCNEGTIVGAAIGGTTEMDTLTRLSDAISMLLSTPNSSCTDSFQSQELDEAWHSLKWSWVSAGYLSFRLTDANLFAFPPGYNEDWLWCLLQCATGNTRVVRSKQTVVHEPPVVRRSTREDIHFELIGDLVFDCLSEQVGGMTACPEVVLQSLQAYVPDESLLPAARVEKLLCQYRKLRENAKHVCGLQTLESHGLRILRDMQRSGELEVDGHRLLSAWCADALSKQRSLAATLRNATVRTAVKRAIEEGIK